MKSTIEGVIEATRNKRDALRSRLTEKQFKTVSKQLDDLGDALKSCSDANAVDLLKDWNRLGDKLKVSRALLQDCGLTVGELRKISNIAGDLVGQSASEVKNILKAHGITNIDDNIVEALCKA
ncbi:hypothetical protein J6T66_06020 [bacterium]|nr:hypothetical protein [bacterium]